MALSSHPSSVGGASVEKVAEADFPSRHGQFRVLGFRGMDGGSEKEIVALTHGDLLADGPAPLLRIHSQCLTGDVLGSLRCDCGPQLNLALEMIAAEGRGVLIYDPQEGRGIGLLNKLRAYQLQDEGADTVEANEQLGFAADERDYSYAVAILRSLGLEAVRFLSNNPGKVAALEEAGVRVDERVPCEPDAGERSAEYLQTKREKLGHLISG